MILYREFSSVDLARAPAIAELLAPPDDLAQAPAIGELLAPPDDDAQAPNTILILPASNPSTTRTEFFHIGDSSPESPEEPHSAMGNEREILAECRSETAQFRGE